MGNLGSFKNGINKSSEAFGHGDPFVNLMDVFGVTRVSNTEALGLVAATEEERRAFNLLAGDVLFVRSSVKPSGVGLTTLVTNNLNRAVFSGFLLRFRSDERLTNSFKAYIFAQHSFRKRVIAGSTVSANTNINQRALQSIRVSFPRSRSEQDTIGNALTDVDDLIHSLGRLIVKKQAIKQGAIQQLLPGRTRLPGFEGQWHNAVFETLATPGRERVDPHNVSAKTRLIELEHIESATGRLSGSAIAGTAVSLKSVFRPGDVLFGKLRAYLRKYWLANTGGLCSTEFWVLRPKPDHVSEFVRYVVETDSFVEIASGGYGTRMPRADWGVVRKIPVLIPEPAEQWAIATVLMDMDSEIAVLRARLEKARNLKTGMMQQLLTGRARLPVQEAAA